MRRVRVKPLNKRGVAPQIVPDMGPPLLRWYEKKKRRLPWRESPTPYSVWVSEVMLQQTRVETVIPYYKRFLERFPSIERLAEAPLEDVLALWSGLGYYRRARSLHEGARVVVKEHAGRFPSDPRAALEVPGVGPYTAGAVLSIAYNLGEPAVDGNVERVLARFLRISESLKSGLAARRLRELARSLIPEGRAAQFNQALMELGATVCTPAAPRCSECPIAQHCQGKAVGDAQGFPIMPPERKSVRVSLHAASVRCGDRYLLQKVTRGPYLRGLWLFPFAEGGPRAQLPSAELELALASRVNGKLVFEGSAGAVNHSITFRKMRIEVFRWRLESSPTKMAHATQHGNLRWARLDELGTSIPVSSIATKIARLIR